MLLNCLPARAPVDVLGGEVGKDGSLRGAVDLLEDVNVWLVKEVAHELKVALTLGGARLPGEHRVRVVERVPLPLLLALVLVLAALVRGAKVLGEVLGRAQVAFFPVQEVGERPAAADLGRYSVLV